MIRFAYTETIAASPEAVFALMSDVSRFDQWLDMDGRPTSTGPVGVGSRFDSTGRLGPLRVRGSGEVTRFENGRAFGFRMVAPGSFDFDIVLEIEPTPGGTLLRGSGSMATRRLWRLLDPILRSELEHGEAREARRLKEIVEAGG